MANDLEAAETLIELQGKINALMMNTALALSKRTEVKTTTRMCEVRQYQMKTIFEACIDVETDAGQAISFWFELGCENKRWHVAASISRTVRDGQDILEEYPESSPAALAELHRDAIAASDWLSNRAKQFQFQHT